MSIVGNWHDDNDDDIRVNDDYDKMVMISLYHDGDVDDVKMVMT